MANHMRSVPAPAPMGSPQQQDWFWDGAQWCLPCGQTPPPCPPSYPPPGCPPWINPPPGQAPWYPGANGGVSFSQSPPANPVRGHFWWDGTSLWLFDGVSWVDTVTGGSAGGILVGSASSPFLSLDKPSSGYACDINGMTNGAMRWNIQLGTTQAETGSNAGSNFTVNRYSDAGGLIDATIYINRATGVVTFSQPIVNPSDIALKSNIEPISEALEKVMSLTGIRFNQSGSGRKHIGLVAQDVEPHVPEVVFESNGKLGISYPQLTALLIEAVKTLAHRVGVLEGMGTEV